MTEQTHELTQEQTEERIRPPVILSLSIDQNTGQVGYTTNAATEYGYRLVKQALAQVGQTVENNILTLMEQRIRAEMSNGDGGE